MIAVMDDPGRTVYTCPMIPRLLALCALALLALAGCGGGAGPVGDTSWKACGLSAELAAVAAEEGFESLKAPVARVALPDLPAPTSWPLERAFYPGAEAIAAAAMRLMGKKPRASAARKPDAFIGPF